MKKFLLSLIFINVCLGSPLTPGVFPIAIAPANIADGPLRTNGINNISTAGSITASNFIGLFNGKSFSYYTNKIDTTNGDAYGLTLKSPLSGVSNNISFVATGSTVSRNLNDRAIDELSLADWVIGDGSDETLKVQAALDAGVGKILKFPGNLVVTISGPVIASNVRIEGAGKFKLKDAANSIMLVLTNLSTIDGVSFDGNGTNQTSTGSIDYTAFSSVRISSGCKIYNCTLTNSFAGGIYGEFVTNAIISRNEVAFCLGTPPIGRVSAFAAAIYLYQSINGVLIDGNNLHDNLISGIFVVSNPGFNTSKNIKILNNNVDYNNVFTFDVSSLNPSVGANAFANSTIQGIITFGGCSQVICENNSVRGTKAKWVEDIDLATDTIISTNHPFINGDQVRMSPAQGGVTGGILYFIKSVTANSYQLSTTLNGTTLDIFSKDFSSPIRVGGPKIFATSFDRTSESTIANNTLYGNLLLGLENNSGSNSVYSGNVVVDATRGFYDIGEVAPSLGLIIDGNVFLENFICAIETRGRGYGITISHNYMEDCYSGSDATFGNAALLNIEGREHTISGNTFVQRKSLSTLTAKFAMQIIGSSNLMILGNHFYINPSGNMSNVACYAAYLKNTPSISWMANSFNGVNESNQVYTPSVFYYDFGNPIYGNAFNGNLAIGFSTCFIDATNFGPTAFIGNVITNCNFGIRNLKTNDILLADGLYNGVRLNSTSQFFGNGTTNNILEIWQQNNLRSFFNLDGNLHLGSYLFGVSPSLLFDAQSGNMSSINANRANSSRWAINFMPNDDFVLRSFARVAGVGDVLTLTKDGDLYITNNVNVAGQLNITGASLLSGAVTNLTLSPSQFVLTDSNKKLISGDFGLGITNNTGIISNNIIAGANIAITSGSNGQLILSANNSSGTVGTLINTANTLNHQLVEFTDNQKTNTGPVTIGLGITNNAGTLSNNIVAGSGMSIAKGASGQLTLTSSGGGPTFVYANAAVNPYTVAAGNTFVKVTIAGVAITLPSAVGIQGQQVIIKDTTVVPNSSIHPVGGQVIDDGATIFNLTSEEDSITFTSDGANWYSSGTYRKDGIIGDGSGVPGKVPYFTDADFVTASSLTITGGGLDLEIPGLLIVDSTSIFNAGITLNTGVPLNIKQGADQRAGLFTLIGGTKTIANSGITANTEIMLTRKTSAGTIGTAATYTRNIGVGFTVTSNNVLDTSTFVYLLLEIVP